MNKSKDDAFVMRGLTVKQKAAVCWFVISLWFLCSTEYAPIWFYLIEMASFVASAYFLKGIPAADCFKKNGK